MSQGQPPQGIDKTAELTGSERDMGLVRA